MPNELTRAEVTVLRKSLTTLKQTLSEVHHAQSQGSNWYTRGHEGLYMQVSMWVRKGVDAVADAENILNDVYKDIDRG